MKPALFLALTLMASAPTALSLAASAPASTATTSSTATSEATDDGQGEPLPASAPTDAYELSAWCYGALGEYLAIYDLVKPDLRDIDHMFGSSVVEDEPYKADMAAYRTELKLISDSVTDAEQASPEAISARGVAAMRKGREIWSLAEAKSHRVLARAWLGWDLPDRCDSNARELATRSIILGKALKYNANNTSALPAAHPDLVAPAEGHATHGVDSDATSGAAAAAPDTAAQAFSTPLITPPAQAGGSTDVGVSAPATDTTQAQTPAETTAAAMPATTDQPASEIANQTPPPAAQNASSDTPPPATDDGAANEAQPTATASTTTPAAPATNPSPPPVTATASPPQTTPNSDQSQEPTL